MKYTNTETYIQQTDRQAHYLVVTETSIQNSFLEVWPVRIGLFNREWPTCRIEYVIIRESFRHGKQINT